MFFIVSPLDIVFVARRTFLAFAFGIDVQIRMHCSHMIFEIISLISLLAMLTHDISASYLLKNFYCSIVRELETSVTFFWKQTNIIIVQMTQENSRLFVSETYATKCHRATGIYGEWDSMFTFYVNVFYRLFATMSIFLDFDFINEKNMVAKVLNRLRRLLRCHKVI